MGKIRLDSRLSAVASLVRDGKTVADIGTDHAYLLAFLLQEGRIEKGIAADPAWEEKNPDWNKVVLIPVSTVRDSNNNIVNFRHDLSLNSTRLVGGKDRIEIKVISSAFNH